MPCTIEERRLVVGGQERERCSPTSRFLSSAKSFATIAPFRAERREHGVGAVLPVEVVRLAIVAGSMPVTYCAEPTTLPRSERTAETSRAASGESASASPAPGDERREAVLRGDDEVGARPGRSIASRFEALIPFASTATNVTSATPIMSAAAVEAVRRGFRVELPRGELAGGAADPRRRPADDRRERLDRSDGESIATPMKRRARRRRSRAAAARSPRSSLKSA